ncbi:MAG: hypothetical protein AB8E15_08355 [Bdellovibrionales bacterium]
MRKFLSTIVLFLFSSNLQASIGTFVECSGNNVNVFANLDLVSLIEMNEKERASYGFDFKLVPIGEPKVFDEPEANPGDCGLYVSFESGAVDAIHIKNELQTTIHCVEYFRYKTYCGN